MEEEEAAIYFAKSQGAPAKPKKLIKKIRK